METKRSDRRKKLEEQLSQIRKRGAALETAIQNTKKREARKFAAPKNSEEAEMQLPPMEEQLGMGMSGQEIMERGTALQKAKLLYAVVDYSGYLGGKSSEEREEITNKILSSIGTLEDVATFKACQKEFQALVNYGQTLIFYYKRFQTAFSVLARLLNLWDNYEKEAARLTAIYNKLKDLEPERIKFRVELTAILGADGEQWEGACLRFDEDRGAFYVDVDLAEGRFREADIAGLEEELKAQMRDYNKQEESLYSQIRKEAATATETLSDFKAYAVVVREFLAEKSILHYTPISIHMAIKNAEEERYTRYLVRNLSFFRSELNQRRYRGETITPEEEHMAVIPDFYEVDASPEVYEDCLVGLKQDLELDL